MSTTQTGVPTPRQPIRLWPGVVIGIVLVLSRYVLPLIAPDTELLPISLSFVGVMVGMLCGVATVIWWLFFSRAPWSDRLGAVALMIVALVATSRVVHESIRGGMMGMMLVIYSIPILSLALIVWAVATHRLSDWARRASLVVAILLACAPWTLVRTAGIIGAGSEFHWRWTPTPEQRLLTRSDDKVEARSPSTTPTEILKQPLSGDTFTKPVDKAVALPEASATAKTEAVAIAPTEIMPAEWPGFRGPERDSVIRGVQIKSDWSASPPVEMWRRPIGPGWSSFAVRGDLLYTQEQRGDDEIVACYRVSTGEPVWRHRDAVRFWESNGGAGPRSTPTIEGNRVYAFGATGILNALDARSGAVVWSRNIASDSARKVPDWGFSSSPLVVDDVVIVAAAGTLVGYDLATGNRRWTGPSYGGSYSSPHRATIDGVVQVLLLGGPGAISVAPATGAVLWQHEWAPGAIVQPALLADGDILVNAITAAGGVGIRRLAIAQDAGGWKIEERWTSNGLKPYFNDFVVHKGHAFGFDGNILSSIDLADGKRKWKGGRYGNGQLLLLSDEDLLLVLSEDGELALVGATPDQYKELARFPALNAKTWNHPVLIGDILLVRNGEEMAAFRLATLTRP
jgi:outer membrane protein assembly factor BamB